MPPDPEPPRPQEQSGAVEPGLPDLRRSEEHADHADHVEHSGAATISSGPHEVPPSAADGQAGSDRTTTDLPESGSDDDGSEPDEPQWWDDPRMPWKGKPGRRDIACFIAFSLTGVFGLIMLPVRPLLIGTLPLLLVALSGSRSGLVTIGALHAIGRADWWWVALILGTLSYVKFDPIFYWCGKLWGRGLLEMVAGRSKRAARNADRAERLAQRFGVLAVALSFVIPILPKPVIFATVGAAGLRLRKLLAVDLVCALALNSLWVYLGYRLGQPAVDVVEVIARYSMWISLGLLVVIIVGAVWRNSRRGADDAQPNSEPGDGRGTEPAAGPHAGTGAGPDAGPDASPDMETVAEPHKRTD